MSVATEEVLAAWRDGERLLCDLSPVHPDHETVLLAVVDMKVLYSELTDTGHDTHRTLAASHDRISGAKAVIAAARQRLARELPE